MKQKMNVQEMVIGALGIALVFLSTFFIKVPNGIQGYFNLGDGFIFIFASLVNPMVAFFIGGLGSALADVAGGYGIYFFFTLIIKGFEGYIVCLLLKKTHKLSVNIFIYLMGSIIMVGGYFIADAFINESWQLSLTGVPANLLQALFGIIIAVIATPLIKKHVSTNN